MKRPSQVIALRASAELLDAFDEARAPFKLSRGDWVRGAAVEKLRQLAEARDLVEEVTELRKAVAENESQITKLRVNLPRCLYILLTAHGIDPEEALKIVLEKLIP